MLFWIIATLLTLAACSAVLLPLSRNSRPEPERQDQDLAVYRDQMRELERDVERGLIGASEAEEAKAELGRSILRRVDSAKKDAWRSNAPARFIGWGAVAAIVLVSWGAYWQLGMPSYADQPLRARNLKDPVAEQMVQAQARLAADPAAGPAWDVLGSGYLQQDRYDEAADALRNAVKLMPEKPERYIALAQAIAGINDNRVTVEAQKALKRALVLEPGNPWARYMLIVALGQGGKQKEAEEALRAMLKDMPPEGPWARMIQRDLADIDKAEKAPAGAAPEQTAPSASAQPAAPSQAEVDAASQMSSEDRTAMIDQMIANLDAKLREKPDNVEGWKQLIRSYSVLGKDDAAQDALERGLKALGMASEGGKQLSDLAATLGLKVKE